MRISDDIKKFRKTAADKNAAVEAAIANSTTGKIIRRTGQFTMAVDWLSTKLGPIYKVVSWPFRKLITGYFWLWDKTVYDDTGKFSKTLAGSFLFGSGLFLYFLALPILGFFWDAGLYAATVKHERVYLFNSQELDTLDNVHSVKGCYVIPCGDNDSTYFRVRATLFNEAWSLLHYGKLFFPDFVSGAVPGGTSECTITSYGFRMKLFVRSFDIYPDLLESTCKPI